MHFSQHSRLNQSYKNEEKLKSVGGSFFQLDLDLQQQGYSSQGPPGGLVSAPQAEGPHVGGAPLTALVDRTLVDVPLLLFVHWDGSDEDDWHGRCQVLQAGVYNRASLKDKKQSLELVLHNTKNIHL